jgi:hypothetical protein
VQYQLAFTYFLKTPNGWTNLLLATVCILIPAVGPIVLIGYQAEVAERLIRDPDLRRHPDFAFDRFMEYLGRGIWPFLVALVASVVIVIPLMLLAAAVVAVGAAAKQPVLGFVGAMFVYVVGAVALGALVFPMMFHAELANRFDLGGGFRFTLSFLKLVGGKAVVTYLVYMLISIPISFVGMLLCFIGLYPASTLTNMAAQHLMVQLYLDYLDRGGEEIVNEEAGGRRKRAREEDEYDDPDADDFNDDGGRRR